MCRSFHQMRQFERSTEVKQLLLYLLLCVRASIHRPKTHHHPQPSVLSSSPRGVCSDEALLWALWTNVHFLTELIRSSLSDSFRVREGGFDWDLPFYSCDIQIHPSNQPIILILYKSAIIYHLLESLWSLLKSVWQIPTHQLSSLTQGSWRKKDLSSEGRWGGRTVTTLSSTFSHSTVLVSLSWSQRLSSKQAILDSNPSSACLFQSTVWNKWNSFDRGQIPGCHLNNFEACLSSRVHHFIKKPLCCLWRCGLVG